MLFKDLTQNSLIYILDKKSVEVSTGKVVTKSFPHLSQGKTEMVVDIQVEAGSRSATYQIPEGLSKTYAGDLVIATEQQLLVPDIETMRRDAEATLASVERQKAIVETTTLLLEELNPVYKEKKQAEERMSKMESKIDNLAELFRKFIDK